MQAVLGPSGGIKIEKGEVDQLAEYTRIFLGLLFKLDKGIKLKERF